MKQILQDLGGGETLLAEVAAPAPRAGALRIATRASLVSLGTERMLLAFGRANLLEKARQQPEKVKQVLAKIRTDGLWPTIDAVRSKLAQPISLGYCNAGVVLEVGAGVAGWKPGDRVLSNGPHAEVVTIPANLCAHIPDTVADHQAPFAVVGAIALQGIRLLAPTLGETFVVSGLGLIGLLAVQLLRAHGARVLGADFDADKCRLAGELGIETVRLAGGDDDLEIAVRAFTEGRGADGVLVAAATRSSDPVNQAARVCRKRGRIVQVGATGLELARADLYEKELSLQVSCSYGPGRYDAEYEDKGHDYPLAYVRWTEQRNFEAVLDQLARKAVVVDPLVSHRYPFTRALDAYETVGGSHALGIVLEYDTSPESLAAPAARHVVHGPALTTAAGVPVLGFLGTGNFTARTLLPALDATGAVVRRKTVVSGLGVSSALVAKKFAFERSSSDPASVLGDPEIDTVFVTTRHQAHARQTLEALAAGKHVFVEKPLCLRRDDLDAIATGAAAARTLLMVGFNRRFSPHVVRMRELLAEVRAPRAMIYTVNAGAIPRTQWVQDPVVGGGRIVGEACHFVDLLRFLAGAPIRTARADFLGGDDGRLGDVASLHLTFEDGSVGTVHYLANGDKTFPKERVEVFCAGRVLQLDNFRDLIGYGWKSFKRFSTSSQDKGHARELTAFLDAVRTGGSSPIPLAELIEVTRATLDLAAEGPVPVG
jgi:predicted dehydrogenase/threonine dehydrogenase-like Zn-dependent dehydrogenase